MKLPENRLARQLSSRLVFLSGLLTFALSLLFTACSGANAGTPSSSAGATTAPTGTATISATPATINFGTVQLNSKAVTAVVALTNVGKSAETIESATIAPTSIFSIQGWTGPITLNPGQAVQLRTVFAPASAGNYSGTLVLVTLRRTPVPLDRPVVIDDPTSPSPEPPAQIHIPVIGTVGPTENGPPPIVAVSVSPSSVVLQSGQSLQFKATVTGTTNPTVSWSAALGSISTSGLYTAPTVATQTIDSISAVSVADSAEYGASSVVVQDPGVWTAVHQHPVTMQFHPGSIWTTPLPANPALLTNSDEVIKNVYQNSDTPSNAIPTCLSSSPGGDSCSNKKVFYYASQSDPIYEVIGAAHVTSQSANNSVGKFFHLTNQAQYSSNVYDQNLSVWDQSTDIDATPGGRIFSDYEFCMSGSCPRTLGNCTCTTTACARTTPACQIAGNYTDYDYPLNDPLGGIGDGLAWTNINSGGGSMFQRMAEIQNNQMNHAILVSAGCVAGGVSFPSTGDAFICQNKTNAIHTGALVYIDSAYNCSALALWQQPFCTALQTYGGYMGPTSGNEYTAKPGFFDNAIESPIAEYQAGGFTPPYTFFSFLNTYSGSLVSCSGSPITRCNIFPLVGMPGLITGDAGNGHVPHLHVVDPCVPRHMAGQSATCTGSWQD